MFMFKNRLAAQVKALQDKVLDQLQLQQQTENAWKQKVQYLETELAMAQKKAELTYEEKLLTFKKEQLKNLTESDIRRSVAEAKLDIYVKFDAKDDRNQIKQMLSEAIKGLTQQAKVNIVK